MNPYKAAKYVLNRTNDKINEALALLEKDYGINQKLKYKLFIWEHGQCMQIHERSPEVLKDVGSNPALGWLPFSLLVGLE